MEIRASEGHNRRVLEAYVIIYTTMLFFGLVENIKGVAFPLIKTEFAVPYSEQGGLVSFTWFGYVAFCLVASLFVQRYGSKRSLITGYALICTGAAATLAAPSFWTVSLALAVVNAGFGFFEVGSNAMATVVFTARSALMMNLMHFFYGFGAILGPQLAGILTEELLFTWRQVYLAVLLPLALFLCFILTTRFTALQSSEQKSAGNGISFLGALRKPVVWYFCITLGFALWK